MLDSSHNSAGPAPFVFEPLEARQLLSAGPWSAQDQAIGLDQATQNYPNLTGAGETVAIIDRGVDYNHWELGGGFGPGFKVVAGYDFQDNTGDAFPYDGDAHGTGTAGQIAAAPHYVNGQLYQGVAPGVNLVALKTNGTADIKAALDWIVAHRSQYNIVAINYLDQSNADENAFVWELQSLTNSGVFIAGPSGNYGPGPANAAVNHLINLVGSVDPNGQLSSFTPRGPAIDLVAPGGGVMITWYENGQPTDVISDGTSWAGPQVVGTAALIKQINPNFTPAQIMAILRDSATPVWDSASGMSYPELNVNAALGLAYQRSGSAGTPAPAPPPVTAPPPPAPAQISTPPTGYAGTPFLGTPFSTGQTIQAKNFDNGGEGVAFHDPAVFNTAGDLYRPSTVDMAWTRAGGRTWALGWTQAGEWLNYTINASAAGPYDLTARVSALGLGGTFHFEVDGVDATGPMTVPNTRGWDRYVNLTHKGVTLSAGVHVVTLVIDTTGANGFAGNFTTFKFTASRVSRHVARPSRVRGGSTAKPALVRQVATVLSRALAA
jgi:hypothetical protein